MLFDCDNGMDLIGKCKTDHQIFETISGTFFIPHALNYNLKNIDRIEFYMRPIALKYNFSLSVQGTI